MRYRLPIIAMLFVLTGCTGDAHLEKDVDYMSLAQNEKVVFKENDQVTFSSQSSLSGSWSSFSGTLHGAGEHLTAAVTVAGTAMEFTIDILGDRSIRVTDANGSTRLWPAQHQAFKDANTATQSLATARVGLCDASCWSLALPRKTRMKTVTLTDVHIEGMRPAPFTFNRIQHIEKTGNGAKNSAWSIRLREKSDSLSAGSDPVLMFNIQTDRDSFYDALERALSRWNQRFR